MANDNIPILQALSGIKREFPHLDRFYKECESRHDVSEIKNCNIYCDINNRVRDMMIGIPPGCIVSSSFYTTFANKIIRSGMGLDEFGPLLRFNIALLQWRKTKKIYKFSKYMTELIKSQVDDQCGVPMEALMQLPYNSIYVQAPNIIPGNDKVEGFIFYFDLIPDMREGKNPEKDLAAVANFQFVDKKYNEIPEAMMLTIDHIGVDDSLITMELGEKHGPGFGTNVREDGIRVLKTCVSLLLYLVSEGADIEPSYMTKRTYKPNSISSKDRFREIEAFDVGFNIERQVEENRKKVEEAIEVDFEEVSEASTEEQKVKKERKPIKPHIRKAHWHHFWTGSKEDPDNRQLVVRWIPPTFVKPNKNKFN